VRWRPGERRLHWRASPPGWLGPAGVWLPRAPLWLPYATAEAPCALAGYDPPSALPALPAPVRPASAVVVPHTPLPARRLPAPPPRRTWSVLPLQQAPLAG
jgi:hypothetical protein